MFYHLFSYLDETYRLSGAGLFQYISFRSFAAILTSLLISMVFGKKIILFIQKKQIGESVRNLGLQGQMEKKGTPTMGGFIILLAILMPTLLFANLSNIYVQLLLLSTVWLGLIGFLDDYIKVFRKNKEGLAGRFKIIGQVILGLIVGSTLYFHEDVSIRRSIPSSTFIQKYEGKTIEKEVKKVELENGQLRYYLEGKSTKTTIPFVKENEFDYSSLITWLGVDKNWTWLIYIPIVIFIITAVSNGVNLTDGIDGLAAGTSAIVVGILAIFAYVSGNVIFSEYLNIMYIPYLGELTIFAGALLGACIGFLWYNAYPAQVFMGDTGSLSLGGLIAVMALMIRKELLIPLLCGIFLIESLSVIIQVVYFKYTKKKTGEGKRVFLMSPLHHHYQKKGYPEPKIVTRFWIVGLFLAVLSIITLKIR